MIAIGYLKKGHDQNNFFWGPYRFIIISNIRVSAIPSDYKLWKKTFKDDFILGKNEFYK